MMSTVAVPSLEGGDRDLLLAQLREAYGRTAYAHCPCWWIFSPAASQWRTPAPAETISKNGLAPFTKTPRGPPRRRTDAHRTP